MKYHVALIISKELIELPKDLSKNPEIKHLIVQEFKMGSDITFGSGHDDNCIIEKPSPEHCNGVTQLFRGIGSSISVAILDWLKNLCASTTYNPLYFKHEAKK